MKFYLLAFDGTVIARIKRIAKSMLGEDGHKVVATRDILVLEITHDKQFVTFYADLEHQRSQIEFIQLIRFRYVL